MRSVTSINHPSNTSRTFLASKKALVAALFIVMANLFAATPVWANACSGAYSPATTYLSDFDGTGAAFSFRSDGQLGPVNGIVGEYDNGQQGVCSAIWTSHTTGGWELSIQNSTQRTFRITLDSTNAVPGSNARQLGTLYVTAFIEDQCSATGNDSARMTSGQSFQCPVVIEQIPTGIAGDTYSLVMTGKYAAAPETSLVQVRCNSNGSDGRCNDWTLDPVGPGVARLKETVVTKRTTTTYNLGDFYLTFHIHATRP